MILFCDIDGTIRDLHTTMVIPYSNTWFDPVFIEKFEVMKKENPELLFGKSFCFEDMLNCVLDLKENVQVIFLTGSPVHHEKHTRRWLDMQGFAGIDLIHVGSMEEKIQYLLDNEGSVLIDDYPYFWKDKRFMTNEIYRRIWLIERKWNVHHMGRYYRYVTCFENEMHMVDLESRNMSIVKLIDIFA